MLDVVVKQDLFDASREPTVSGFCSSVSLNNHAFIIRKVLNNILALSIRHGAPIASVIFVLFLLII